MVTFVGLTGELVETTFSFVDRPDLLSLCLTCRSLLPLARRRLFRHVVLKTHKDSQGTPFILKIMSVLKIQRDLALCVQSLELLGHKPDPLWNAPTGEDEVFPHASYYSSSWETVLIKPLKSQSDKVYIDLIAQLHNLRDLRLGLTFSALVLKFDKHFRNLRSIIFEDDRHYLESTKDSFELMSIDPYLFKKLCRLPSVTNLDLEVPCDQLIPMQFDGLYRMPTLSSLVLHRSVIDSGDLRKLLASTPNLNKFHLDFSDDTDRARRQKRVPILHVNQIGYALLQISGTLKDLKFSVDWFDEQHNGPQFKKGSNKRALTWGPKGYLDTLGQFKQLKYLEIAPVTLLGFWPESSLAAVLPPGLRQLDLLDDLAYWWTYPWTQELILWNIRAWLQKRWETTPFLERLVLRFRYPQHAHGEGTDYWAKEDSRFGEEFLEICQLAGIKGAIDLQFPKYNSEAIADLDFANDWADYAS